MIAGLDYKPHLQITLLAVEQLKKYAEGLTKNGILLPKLFWPTALWEKIVLEIEKNFWNSRLKA